MGARSRFQEAAGLSVFIKKTSATVSSFLSDNEREVGSDEDLSEASEGSRVEHGNGGFLSGVQPGTHWPLEV